MKQEKYPLELMLELCKGALLRSRKRIYTKCFYSMVKEFKNPKKAIEYCRQQASRVKFFHKHDFEVEARIYIAEHKRYDMKLSSLLRKLRALAGDPDVKWIRWYKGEWGRRVGMYELTSTEI